MTACRDAKPWHGRVLGLALLASGLAGCGTPPDLRYETMRGITGLGTIRPFYPFDETHRIGNIYIQDTSVEEARLRPYQVVTMRLSEALVPYFQRQQAARNPIAGRHAASRDGLREDAGAGTEIGFVRQPAEAERARALTIAAFPGYSLATVTQVSGAAFMPEAFATFLAGIGIRNTTSLEMEAIGVEMADVPLENAIAAIREACSAGGSLGGGGYNEAAWTLVQTAHYQLESWRAERGSQRGMWQAAAPVDARMFVPWRIYYLRGIRFIIKDTYAVSAVAQAAARLSARAGAATPPPIQSVQVTNAPSAGAAEPAGAPGLLQQVEAMRTAIAGAGTPQFIASLAQATARGVELVQLFDRPLAFGHQSFWVPVQYQRGADGTAARDENGQRLTRGFEPVCAIARVAPARAPT